MGSPNAQDAHPAGTVAQQPTGVPAMEAAPPAYFPSPAQSHGDAIISSPPQPAASPMPSPQPFANPMASPQPAAQAGAPQQKGPYAGAPYANPQGHALAFPVATPLDRLGAHPAPADCPFCGMRALTITTEEASTMTHVTALLCCLICICLAFVPYATKMGHDVEHRCGSCRRLLAIARNSGRVEVVAYAPAVPIPGQNPHPPQAQGPMPTPKGV